MVSATQPPPVCVKVTQISRRASVCIEFRKFHFGDKSLSGCSTFKASAWGITILTLDLGCFQMQVPDSTQHVEEELRYHEGGIAPVRDPEPVYIGEVQMDSMKPFNFKKNYAAEG